MHLLATYPKLPTLGLLGLFLWLPLANNAQPFDSHANQESDVLSSKPSGLVSSDIAMDFGGLADISSGSNNAFVTFTVEQLRSFNQHCSIFFEAAKTIFLANKELILRQSLHIIPFVSEETLIIH